eukprot:g38582.t1
MQSLLMLQMMGVNVMEDLQKLKSPFASEASKIIFLTRVCTVEQDEMCSHFFFQKVHEESSVFSNLQEDSLSKKLTSTECCRLAHSKLLDCMLRYAVKLRAVAAKCSGQRPPSMVFLPKYNGSRFSYWILPAPQMYGNTVLY